MQPEKTQSMKCSGSRMTLSEAIQEVFKTYDANIKEVEKTNVASVEELNLTLN